MSSGKEAKALRWTTYENIKVLCPGESSGMRGEEQGFRQKKMWRNVNRDAKGWVGGVY